SAPWRPARSSKATTSPDRPISGSKSRDWAPSSATTPSLGQPAVASSPTTPILVVGNTAAVTAQFATAIYVTGSATVEGNTVSADADSFGINAPSRFALVKGNTVTGGQEGINVS